MSHEIKEWFIATLYWAIVLIKLPISILLILLLLPLIIYSRNSHTKFYDHMIVSQPILSKYLCGYCYSPLTSSNKPFHAYTGQHKWWCYLKRAMRNELIVSSWEPPEGGAVIEE